jgi:hypothetical protein
MATGAGKTYTVVNASYRLLKHAGARRVLFLVDRNNLGKQARAEYARFETPDDFSKFAELYNVQRLTSTTLLDLASVVISTVQRLYAMLRGQELPAEDADPEFDDYDSITEAVELEYNAAIPPETFDLMRQRTGMPYEVDIEPSWAVEAALDPRALVDDGRSRTGLSIRVIGLSPSCPAADGDPRGAVPVVISGACYGTACRKLAGCD